MSRNNTGQESLPDKMLNESVSTRVTSWRLLAIVFSILLFPGATLGWLSFYIFMYKAKWKPSMITVVFIVIAILLITSAFVISPYSSTLLFPTIRDNPKELYQNFAYTYVYTTLWLGDFFFYFLSLVMINKINRNPEYRAISGWAENFRFAKTPLEKRKKEKLKELCHEGEEYSEEGAPLGVLDEPVKIPNEGDSEYEKMPYDKPHLVRKYYEEAIKHTIVTGATGSGKTVSLLNQVYNDIVNCIPVIFIDCKNALDVTYFLSKWAAENNRPFYHFQAGSSAAYNNPYNKKGKASYDPLRSGSVTYKAELLLSLRSYSLEADVYKERARTVLTGISQLINQVDRFALPKIPWEQGGFSQFLAAMEPENLYDMLMLFNKDLDARAEISHQDEQVRERLTTIYKAMNDPRDQTGFAGQVEEYKATLGTLLMSSYGEWLVKSKNGLEIDLMDVSTSDKGPVVLFSLSPLEEQDFARSIGSLILTNISQVAAAKNAMNDKTYTSLYIDEFQTLDVMAIKGILEKARSAGFATTLSLQDLSQITSSGEYAEDMVNSIVNTCGNFLVHAGANSAAAERFSSILGRHNVKKVISSTGRFNTGFFAINRRNKRSGNVSTQVISEDVLPPHEFQTLSSPNKSNGYKSTAYYITKSCVDPEFVEESSRPIARCVHVVVPEEITDGVPDEFVKAYNKKAGKRRRRRKKKYKENVSHETLSDQNFKIEPIGQTKKQVKTKEKTFNDIKPPKPKETNQRNVYAEINQFKTKKSKQLMAQDFQPTKRKPKEKKKDFNLPSLD